MKLGLVSSVFGSQERREYSAPRSICLDYTSICHSREHKTPNKIPKQNPHARVLSLSVPYTRQRNISPQLFNYQTMLSHTQRPGAVLIHSCHLCNPIAPAPRLHKVPHNILLQQDLPRIRTGDAIRMFAVSLLLLTTSWIRSLSPACTWEAGVE
jgi:hypothetical protein